MALSSGGFRSFDSIAKAATTPSVTRSPMAANPNRTVSAAPRGPIASSPLRSSVSARALSVGGGGGGSARVAGPASIGKVRGPIAGPIGGGMRSAALAAKVAPAAAASLGRPQAQQSRYDKNDRAGYLSRVKSVMAAGGPKSYRDFRSKIWDAMPGSEKAASMAYAESIRSKDAATDLAGQRNALSAMVNRLAKFNVGGNDYTIDDVVNQPSQFSPLNKDQSRKGQGAYSLLAAARNAPHFGTVADDADALLSGKAKPLHDATHYVNLSVNKPKWATPDKFAFKDPVGHSYYRDVDMTAPKKASWGAPAAAADPSLPDPNPYRVAGMDAAKADLAKRPAAASAADDKPYYVGPDKRGRFDGQRDIGDGRMPDLLPFQASADVKDSLPDLISRRASGKWWDAGDSLVSGKGKRGLDDTDPRVLSSLNDSLAQMQKPAKVISAARSPDDNGPYLKNGGAANSRHLHKDAVDVDTVGWDQGDNLALKQAMSARGAKGVGAYASGASHFDVRPGRPKVWAGYGKSKNAPIPSWAKDFADNHLAGKYAKAGVGKDSVLSPAMALGAKSLMMRGDIPLPDRNTRDLTQDDVSLAGSAPVRGPIAGLGRRLPAVSAGGSAGGAFGGAASVGGAGSDLPPQNVPLPSRNPRITSDDVVLGGGGAPIRGPMAGVPRRITGDGGVGTSAFPGGRASASANGIGLPDWQQALIAGDAPDLTPVSGNGSVGAGSGRVGGARGPIAGVRPHIAGSLGRYGGGIPGGAGVSGSAVLPPQIAAVAGAPSGGVAAGASVAGSGAVRPRGPIASRYGSPRNPNDGLGGLNPAAAPASADLEPSILDQWKQAALDKLSGAGDYVKDAATKAIVTDQVSKAAGAAGDYIGQGVDYVGGKIAGAVGSVNDAAQSGMQQVADVAPMLQVYADSGKLWQQMLAQQGARNRPDQLAPVAGDAPPASVPGGSEGGNVGQPNQPSQSLAQQYDAILREIAKDQTNPVLQAKFKQIEAALIEELKRKQAMNQRGAVG